MAETTRKKGMQSLRVPRRSDTLPELLCITASLRCQLSVVFRGGGAADLARLQAVGTCSAVLSGALGLIRGLSGPCLGLVWGLSGPYLWALSGLYLGLTLSGAYLGLIWGISPAAKKA